MHKHTKISLLALLVLSGYAPAHDAQPSVSAPVPATTSNGVGAAKIADFSKQLQVQQAGTLKGVGIVTTRDDVLHRTVARDAARPISGTRLGGIDTHSPLGVIQIPAQSTRVHDGLNVVALPQDQAVYRPGDDGPAYDCFLSNDDSYRDIQFAMGQTTDENPQLVGVYWGNTTPAALMPTSGHAQYRGVEGIVLGVDKVNADYYGKVVADVDFANKTLEFKVQSGDDYVSVIAADIVGSAFIGKQGAVYIEGLFAGEHATEITGKYRDVKANVHGIFAAQKVQQQ